MTKDRKKPHWFWRSFFVTLCLLGLAIGLFAVDYNTRTFSRDGGEELLLLYRQSQQERNRWRETLSPLYAALPPEWQWLVWGEEKSTELFHQFIDRTAD